MAVYHFKNFEMLDPDAGELRDGHELVVEGDTIKEVSEGPVKLANAELGSKLHNYLNFFLSRAEIFRIRPSVFKCQSLKYFVSLWSSSQYCFDFAHADSQQRA